ncbi:hypothetical protein AB1M95_16050 [Sulfitobacter sp. LCG007]
MSAVVVEPTWLAVLVQIVDLTKSLAWPISAIFIAWLFSGEIKKLLPRIQKVSTAGIELRHAEQGDRKLEDETGAKVSDVKTEPLTDPVAIEIESANLEALNQLPQQDPKSREEKLLRALTVQQLHKNFAFIYVSIFGSQIRALRELNSRPIPRAKAEKFFDDLGNKYSEFRDWSLDNYLDYLFRWRLIEEKNKEFYITETGRNFLQFIASHQLSEERHL